MKILITGGAGFIGSHIADAYLAAGHEVTIVDDLSTGRMKNIPSRAAFVKADIRDREAVERLFGEGRFDAVNHHAAQMDVRRSVADPAHDASVNIIGVLTLLEAARAHGVRRVVFASSGGAIYGEQDVFPAPEEHPTRPISPYGVAKLTTERYLYYYDAVHGIRSVSLRYANVYGPRQNPEGEAGVVAIFTGKMLRGEEPLINGPGTQTRDYVYVGDVARANLAALQVERTAAYNIGTARETDVTTLFRALRPLTGSSAAERHGPAKAGEQLRSVLDVRRAAADLGWRPQVPLEEGLARTVEYFRAEEADAARRQG
jgi:UDP-glucose 4-epimerase